MSNNMIKWIEEDYFSKFMYDYNINMDTLNGHLEKDHLNFDEVKAEGYSGDVDDFYKDLAALDGLLEFLGGI